MDLGINIDTKDGIDKANKEIKDWLNNLQSDIDKNKLKISFDIPKELDKYLESVSKSSSKLKEVEVASDSLKDKLKELEEVWGLLTAEERASGWGSELRAEWRELSNEADGLDGTLRQAVKTIDSSLKKIADAAEESDRLAGRIRALEKDWAMLNEVERQGAEGQALKDKYNALIEATGGYATTLKAAVAQDKKLADQMEKDRKTEEAKAQRLREQAEYARTYKGRLEELEKAWVKLDATQRKGAEGQAILAQVKALNTEFGKYKGTLSQVIAEEQRHEHQLKKTGKAMSQLKNIAASYLSVYMGIRLTKQMADITGEFEMQKNAIAAMLNNAERAETIFKQIKTLAVVSPFEVKDLVSYAKQLTAFSVPYEELYDTTKRLADISAGLGVDMGRLILAFGQVRSSAVLRGQELRQFTEAGIPLIDELVRKFKELGEEGITTADIFDKIYTRQVPFEMVRDIMFEMTEEGGKFYRMQEVQADTLKGKITNLADAYDIFLAEIGEKGSSVMGGFVDFLKDIMEHHESLTKAVLVGASAYGTVRIAIMLTNVSFQTLKATMSTMPWGALAVALSSVVYAISSHNEEMNKAVKLYEEMDATIKRLITRTESEEAALKLVFLRLADAEKGSEKYNKIKNEIIRKYGEYMKGLSEEIDAVEDLDIVYKKLHETMLAISKGKAKQDAMESITSAYISKEAESWANISQLLDKKGYVGEAKAEMFKTLKDYFFDMEKVVEDGFEGIEDIINKFEERGRGIFMFGMGDQTGQSTVFSNKLRKELTDVLDFYKARKKGEEDINKAFQAGALGDGVPPKVIESYETVNELLKTRAEIEASVAKIQGDKRTQKITKENEEALKGYALNIDEVNKKLALLGYEEPKKTGAKKVDEELKAMLARMRKDIDDYTRQVNIWEALQKPYDKSLETFLREQLKELGVSLGSGSVLDMEWRNIILGKDLKPEVEDMARSIFNTLRDNALKARQESEKELKELADKYATYSEKIAQINAKYQKDIDSMSAKGMSDEQVNEALRKQSKELDDFINTHVKGTDDFAVFLADVAGKGLDELVKLSEQIEKEMADVAKKFGTKSEVYQVLRAMITELNKLKEEAVDKSDDESSRIYQNWRRVQSVLNNVNKNFRDIESSIGGLSGEAIGVIGEVTNATLSSMNAIEAVFKEAGLKISEISIASIQALTGVQKASIALTVLSTATKAITKIGNFITNIFNARHNREIKKQKEAIEQLQKEYKILQQEMKKAYGSDYFKEANREIENLRKQQAALNKQLEAENKKSGKKAKKNRKELENEILDTTHAIEDSISDMIERMAGTSLASAANSFADAWLDAYYSFEDTSKAIEDRFKEMARNMVIENVIAGRIGKILDPSFEYLERALEDGVMSESEMKTWLGMMENANEVMQNESVYWEQIMESMGSLLDRGKGESNLSGISKGIANASEDTVLLVGGYLDSIRFKLFPYIDYMMGDFTTTINLIMNAQIQQVNHLREIELATKDTSRSNRELVEAINSVIEIGDNGKRLKV